jgi:MoaA/NifB/PqqE/SkfB family radical SAM enzyme
MYGVKDYITRGSRFANNTLFPTNKKLSTLMFYATDLCDSACKHCLIWAKRPPAHLSKERIIEVMKSKCVTKDTLVGLEGGEFLLHPQALEIMEWLSKNHPKWDLLSNCLKPDNLINAVKKYPPKRLYISLDGNKESYKYMRGKDGYESVLKVIENLKDIVPISVMFTLSPYNDFEDMKHVAEVCKFHGIDMRIGVYNDIAFFDTVEKAHETDIGDVKHSDINTISKVKEKLPEIMDKKYQLTVLHEQEKALPKHDEEKVMHAKNFKENIPQIVKEFKENYDFLVLYDEWRKKKVKLNCYSILDSVVILPNGDVPICQNLDVILGNVNEKSLDEIFNSRASADKQKDYCHNCNQCWISFHRKYDVVLYRTMEKFFPKSIISKMMGYYQWESDSKETYAGFMQKMEDKYV